MLGPDLNLSICFNVLSSVSRNIVTNRSHSSSVLSSPSDILITPLRITGGKSIATNTCDALGLEVRQAELIDTITFFFASACLNATLQKASPLFFAIANNSIHFYS